jgi:hypothetical protein
MISKRTNTALAFPPLPSGEGWGEEVVGAQFIAPGSGLDDSSPCKSPLTLPSPEGRGKNTPSRSDREPR